MKNGSRPAGTQKTYFILIAGIVILLVAGAFFFLQQQNEPAPATPVRETVVAPPVPERSKSTPVLSDTPQEPAGDEESPYNEYRVITKDITLPGRKLLFGDKVFADERKSAGARKIILLQDPYKHPGSTAYQVNAGSLIEEYRFSDYKSNFSLAPFATLSPAVKNIILAENYSDGNKYGITQNADRAGVCLATGDFDGDGIGDVAVIMDNNEQQVCRLLILCTNKATRQPYVAFAENYADRMKLRGFRKRASVYMNTEHFVPAPQDGLIVRGEDVVLAVIYDSGLQKFKTYYQE